jgi:hypothetical protein
MDDKEKVLCPSYRCVAGAQLIGIVQADGKVSFVGTPLGVDREFRQQAGAGRPPEVRLRFAGTCARGGCAQWTGAGCGVADRIPALEKAPAEELPACGIRPRCRWFQQRGPAACAVCPYIVRGASSDDAP